MYGNDNQRHCFLGFQADWVVSNVQLLSLVFKNYVSLARDNVDYNVYHQSECPGFLGNS